MNPLGNTSINKMTRTLQMWVFVDFVKAGGLYIDAVRFARPYEAAALGLLLQELDAVVDVELDGPPVPVVAHEHWAQLQAALAVGFGRDPELQEVLL